MFYVFFFWTFGSQGVYYKKKLKRLQNKKEKKTIQNKNKTCK